MEADKEEDGVDAETFQADKRKMIQPASLKDPKLDKLKEALLDWINSTLKAEHIVVRSLEEDLYDGLVLHHLLARLAGVHLSLEEIALTASAQIRKLEVVLEELDQRLGQQDTKWDVSPGSALCFAPNCEALLRSSNVGCKQVEHLDVIHKKDLLATLHLLVAMVRRFQPEVELPTDVKVQVAVVEVSRRGIRSDVQTEVLTEASGANSEALSTTERDDPMEHLLKLEAHEVTAVKQAILHFVNKTMASVGLQVSDLDNQFSDGVILLLLIGQLEGFFIPLSDFSLIPVSHEEMLHNVSLALSLLRDLGLRVSTVEAHDVVSQDVAATLKVLYALFRKHGCS
ncbi:gamma-parvin isoform X2 [Dunckerocampus dactyliophorus]|nr:gamma-parvin isoform X2 [Dunckerocampus dactyliophorus]XP_054631725.1 gamma-parvin isoform X2 [Dunckerocampus dactyliophorus]